MTYLITVSMPPKPDTASPTNAIFFILDSRFTTYDARCAREYVPLWLPL